MKLRLHRPTLIGIALLGLSIAAVAQDQGREFHWTGKLNPDQVVEIKNISGNIDADGVSGDQIEVSAEKLGPRADQVRIEVVPSSSGVTICAIYPGSMGGSGSCEPGRQWHTSNVHNDNTRVNFTVHLPKSLRFSAISVNGGIKAEDLGKSVEAKSVNGSVRISTDEWAEASSVNGAIHVRMGHAGWTGTLRLNTVNGAIDLEMPDDLSADVKLSSVNGRIDSAFPISITGGFVGHTAKGTIGSGGRELVANTVNGAINLRKAGGV